MILRGHVKEGSILNKSIVGGLLNVMFNTSMLTTHSLESILILFLYICAKEDADRIFHTQLIQNWKQAFLK